MHPHRERATARADDQTLVAWLAAGDAGAPLAELYGRYARAIYGLGLRLLGDAGLAEELVQDTFVRLWRAAPRFDPARGHVRTFLFTLARRAAVDLVRRRASQPALGLLDGESLTPADVSDAFDLALLAIEVREALARLPLRHRQVLELAFMHDLTQPQIAARLGIPVGTVKSRTYHGLRKLNAALQGRR